MEYSSRMFARILHATLRFLARLHAFRSLGEVPPGSIVLFPVRPDALGCGFIGILDYRPAPPPSPMPDDDTLASVVGEVLDRDLDAVLAGKIEPDLLAGGDSRLVGLWEMSETLKERPSMVRLVTEPEARKRLRKVSDRLDKFLKSQEKRFADKGSRLDSGSIERVNASLVRLRDIVWALDKEVLGAIDRILALGSFGDGRGAPPERVWEIVKLNATFDNLDRLEVRGRDSAGLSVLVNLPGQTALEEWGRRAGALDLAEELARRQALPDLETGTILLGRGPLNPSISFIYKVAAEVGKLGDNVRALREQVQHDKLLHLALDVPPEKVTCLAHTRWASNGIINIPNCHPLDQRAEGEADRFEGTIQVVLNGDIDNYPELKAAYEGQTGRRIPDTITTDAKVIACWIEKYLREGETLAESFRKAVADFRGSAAIAMHSDLAPGKIFLSLKGSGQAVYVGLAPDRVLFASEVYGLVSETSRYFRLDGETLFDPGDPASQGQIVVLDCTRQGLAGITSRSHAGGAVEIRPKDVRKAAITTRDIDRRGFDHFFLKEIWEGPLSVGKTLRGKFELLPGPAKGERRVEFNLGEEILPAAVRQALEGKRIRRVHLIGQGTASVAAMGIASVLRRYLDGQGIHVEAFKASDLSGFHLRPDMSDTLTIAVSQSGTTTDTNRAIDMVSSRGGATLAIVNRRGSDLTDKVDGVFYTSDGRDVEMSVASTKAFYSQVVAGAILSAGLARILGAVPEHQLALDLEDLSTLPARMEQVLALSDTIADSARRLAPSRRHWAVVGSGPNHIAAHEVRIKLSELCYKSIACDHVEDKKHIDLSSEPLILTLAAGNHESVIGDVVKDVAIFRAHKAVPVVFCAEGEDRFDAYAESVVHLPRASETVSLILNTVAGHLWGYYAALAINSEGDFFKEVRQAVVESLTGQPGRARDPMIGSPEVRGRLLEFYRAFQGRKQGGRFQSGLDSDTCANLLLLFKYSIDHTPLDHFEIEFGRPGSRLAVYQEFLVNLNRAIDNQVRPIDAIKHQAKTVTVGTSRIEVLPSGPVFAALAGVGVGTREVSYRDLATIARLQPAVVRCDGLTLYRVESLDSLGNPDGDSTIAVEKKTGVARDLSSRADHGTKLSGTKRSIVLHKDVFLGIGKGDDRKILILPLYDERFRVARLALFHVAFAEDLPLETKIRVLGVAYEDVKNAVTESNIDWTDDSLAPLSPEFLLTRSVDQIAEAVVQRASETV